MPNLPSPFHSNSGFKTFSPEGIYGFGGQNNLGELLPAGYTCLASRFVCLTASSGLRKYTFLQMRGNRPLGLAVIRDVSLWMINKTRVAWGIGHIKTLFTGGILHYSSLSFTNGTKLSDCRQDVMILLWKTLNPHNTDVEKAIPHSLLSCASLRLLG